MSNVRRHIISNKVPRKVIVKKSPGKIDLTSINRMMKIDEIVNREANGCFTVATSKNIPMYKAKQLYEYAQATGKNTSELNEEELAMFIID